MKHQRLVGVVDTLSAPAGCRWTGSSCIVWTLTPGWRRRAPDHDRSNDDSGVAPAILLMWVTSEAGIEPAPPA
jgi:hypothetical protein